MNSKRIAAALLSPTVSSRGCFAKYDQVTHSRVRPTKTLARKTKIAPRALETLRTFGTGYKSQAASTYNFTNPPQRHRQQQLPNTATAYSSPSSKIRFVIASFVQRPVSLCGFSSARCLAAQTSLHTSLLRTRLTDLKNRSARKPPLFTSFSIYPALFRTTTPPTSTLLLISGRKDGQGAEVLRYPRCTCTLSMTC